jgi:hypothetical protein
MIESQEENTPWHRRDYRTDFTALATPSQFIFPRGSANLISIGFTLIGRISALALQARGVLRRAAFCSPIDTSKRRIRSRHPVNKAAQLPGFSLRLAGRITHKVRRPCVVKTS